MREFNILTPGEKIKIIREKFYIKQEDLAGNEITRNLISIIENNKANLTEHTAKILTENINRICEEKSLKFSVTEEYLMEDTVSQAKKIANEYIDYINDLPTEEISNVKDKLYEINYFCKNYKLEEKKSELYMAIGRKFKLNQNYIKSFDYYLKAFESTSSKEVTLITLMNLGMCSVFLSKYEEAIDYFNLILDLENSPIKMQFGAEFNIALCYKKLNKFEKALETLEPMEEKYKDDLINSKNQYVDFYVLKGICLTESKSFNAAITVFKNLLKLDISEKSELIILSSLADVYRYTKDYTKLDKTCKKIMAKIEVPQKEEHSYEGDICLALAKNLTSLNNSSDIVKSLLIKALKSFKSGKSSMCMDDVEQILQNLLDSFIANEDDNGIDYLKNEFLELIDKEIFPRKNFIAFKFIKYYNYKQRNKDIDSLIDFITA